MNLGVFLSLGESFTDLKRTGQNQLMINQNIRAYARSFHNVYIFTYQQESIKLPKNCTLVIPPFKLHRYLYGLLLPFIHSRTIRGLDINRCFQLSGTLPAIIAKIFFQKKFVFNLGYDYSTFAKIEGKPIQANIFQLLQPIAIRMANKVIVKNKSLMRATRRLPQATSHKLRAKFTYLPNGVDTHKFKPINKTSRKPYTILFVGRLEPQKNIFNLVKAVGMLKKQINLKIIGDGSLRNQLILQVKKSNITLKYIKNIRHSLMPKIYQQADLFILPSIKEGSPKVLLEAMASGLPCIASNIPEHQEIITHNQNGILTATSPQSLYKAIALLLYSETKRLKLGKNARKHIKKDFNINDIINHEIKIIQNI